MTVGVRWFDVVMSGCVPYVMIYSYTQLTARTMANKEPITGDRYDEYVQETVEEVDELLRDALEHGNTYRKHEEVRPSAMMAFDAVEEARMALDKIDNREFKSNIDERE